MPSRFPDSRRNDQGAEELGAEPAFLEEEFTACRSVTRAATSSAASAATSQVYP